MQAQVMTWLCVTVTDHSSILSEVFFYVMGYVKCLMISVCFEHAGDNRTARAVRAACEEVGSVSNFIFEMRFNPNVFSPGTKENHTLTHTHTPNLVF